MRGDGGGGYKEGGEDELYWRMGRTKSMWDATCVTCFPNFH